MKRIAILVFLVTAFGLIFATPGCGGGGESKKSVVLPGPAGTGTGTGTGTNTGTGGDPGSAVGQTITLGSYDFMNESIIQGLGQRFETELNPALWRATEGQMYIKQIIVKNQERGPDINVIIDPFEGIYCRYDAGGYPTECMGWALPDEEKMGLAGGCIVKSFLHEWCHVFFYRYVPDPKPWSEEYDCDNGIVCPMRSGIPEPGDAVLYCDSTNCVGRRGWPCWDDYILKKFPTWTHTGATPGACPGLTITIEQ